VQTHFEGKRFPAALAIAASVTVGLDAGGARISWSKSAGKKANLTINGGAEGLLLQQ
jgi:hypothetical protein